MSREPAEPGDGLSGPEIVLLIEALDALIPFREEGAVSAKGWLEAELGRERLSLSDKLFSKLCVLIEAPGASRRSVREGYAAAMRELREVRQSTPRPLS